MKNRNLTVTIFLYILVLIFISISIIGVAWIYDARVQAISASDELIRNERENIQSELKSFITSLVDYIEYQRIETENFLKEDIYNRTYEAYSIIENTYNTFKDTKSDEEIQEIIISTLRNIRFNDGRGYYFIDTLSGDVVLYPVFPESEGTNLLGLQDDLGKYVLQEEIELVNRENEGFIEGNWKKPEGNPLKTYKKITYVKKFEPFNWYVGCGEYVDDVETDTKNRIIDYINSLSYGKDNNQYVFIHNFQGIEIANGRYPEIIGSNNYDLTDPNGVFVFQEQIKIANSEEQGGFLEHEWFDHQSYINKLTYVNKVKDWNWVIGTSLPLNDISDLIYEKDLEISEHFKTQLFRILSILVIAIIFTIVIARILVKMIHVNVESVISNVEHAADNLEEIEPEFVTFNDFQSMVNATNHMTNTINSLMHIDELTGIYNKKYSLIKLEELHYESKENQFPFCVILLDIDHFKVINEKYGSLIGDEILKVVSKIIEKSIGRNGIVSRFGGAEIMVLLPNTEKEVATNIAERLLRIVSEKKIEPLDEFLTMSGSVVLDEEDTIKSLIKTIEVQLYKAKKLGRNRIVTKG